MMSEFAGPPEPSYIGLPSFLKLPYVTSAQELRRLKPDIAILGAPMDMGTTIRPGARFGPRAIRLAAGYVGGSPVEPMYHLGLGVAPFKHLRVVDSGDANCPPHSIEQGHAAIRQKVGEVLDAGALPIVLGGDHSITLPAATAVADRWGHGRIGIVHFDAHADTAPDSFGGSLIAHGSPMRRLIESGAVRGSNFVQVGLRGYWPPEDVLQWMRAQRMRWHLMAEIEERGIDAVIGDAIAEAMDGPEYTYLSVDIDVIDPGFAPGTGTPEPGGILPSDLLRAVRRIVSRVPLAARDVVEVSPAYDGPGAATAETAHRVVLEAISALALKRLQASRAAR
jgi:agmatinase